MTHDVSSVWSVAYILCRHVGGILTNEMLWVQEFIMYDMIWYEINYAY